VFVVELVHESAERPAHVRADVFAVIGSFAEGSTHVRERSTDAVVEFDVATGLLDDQTPFRSHGHLVRFRVRTMRSRSV
jgi:hypothetical protein